MLSEITCLLYCTKSCDIVLNVHKAVKQLKLYNYIIQVFYLIDSSNLHAGTLWNFLLLQLLVSYF